MDQAESDTLQPLSSALLFVSCIHIQIFLSMSALHMHDKVVLIPEP
jgi:hypothetical protein